MIRQQLVSLSIFSTVLLGASPLALAQEAHLASPAASKASSANEASAPVPTVDVVTQEKEDRAAQIKSSAHADAVLSPNMPKSGQVISTNKQKQSAAMEASKIVAPVAQPTIPATINGRPTIALALGGGGARGAAHIGVLRVFAREGIPVDYIVGNSMGAIVGGLYCAGLSLDQITNLMEDGSLRHAYMPGPLVPKVLIAPLRKIVHPLGGGQYAGLFSGKKFSKYLDQELPQESMTVQETKIPFSAVATNLLDGQAYRLSYGPLATVMKASSAISPLIQPVAIDEQVYVDGGVRANLPVMGARQTGAGIVVAVLVDEPLVKMSPKRFMHLRGIASRLADIVLAVSDERQLQYADIVVNPNVSGIPILSKHPQDVEKAIKAGELAAEKALPQIRAALKHPPQPHPAVAVQIGGTTN